jgi:hypothetical protein
MVQQVAAWVTVFSPFAHPTPNRREPPGGDLPGVTPGVARAAPGGNGRGGVAAPRGPGKYALRPWARLVDLVLHTKRTVHHQRWVE